MPRGDERFPREEHMRFQWEFNLVKQIGVVCAGQLIVLSACYQSEESSRHIGFVISRRLGRAVVRNRIRRRLREVYRLQRRWIGLGFWLVLIARPPSAKASFKELEAEFMVLYQSARKMICTQA